MLEHIDINGIIKGNVIFLAGDNKETFYDSRDYGFIPKEDVLGKVLFELQNLIQSERRGFYEGFLVKYLKKKYRIKKVKQKNGLF